MRTISMGGKRLPLKDAAVESAQTLLLLVLLMWIAFPFFWAVSSALRPPAALFQEVVTWLPEPVTLQNFQWAMGDNRYVRTFQNSLIVSFLTAFVAMTICAAAGYSLARYRYPGKGGIMIFLVFTQMLPRILVVIPIFVIFSQLKLVNTYAGLTLGYATFAAPFATLMLRGYFANFPMELEEAALIDGCNRFQAFMRVILPLTIPGIIATGLFAFVLAWNDLLFAMVLTNSVATNTVGVYLNTIAHSQFAGTNWSGLLAAGVLVTLPVVVFFVFLQQHLVKGMTAGALKS